jgi:tRNA U34 5-carboxymethylaminomethyl modifying GTPase MnmE/TrmE
VRFLNESKGPAVRALGELTGRDASEQLVDAIFARFCVGK